VQSHEDSYDSCYKRYYVIGVWQEVAVDSLKFHFGLSLSTFLRPAGGPPLKRPLHPTPYAYVLRLTHGHLQHSRSAGRPIQVSRKRISDVDQVSPMIRQTLNG
jgi:hypothetical protein